VTDQDSIDAFNRLYYSRPEDTIYTTHWLGYAAQKYPTDLWIYQEIMHELRPDFIVETGTYWGGSALFLAGICDLLGHGEVITIDVRQLASGESTRPEHPRITYVEGSSIEPAVVDAVKAQIGDAKTVMVILDSDHGREHVFNELKVWADVVTMGSYLIVEDTNVNGHPVEPGFGPGPMEALDLFLSRRDDFLPDRSRERLLLTANPRGYLRKVEGGGVEARLLLAQQKVLDLQAALDTGEERLQQLDAQLAVATEQLQQAGGALEQLGEVQADARHAHEQARLSYEQALEAQDAYNALRSHPVSRLTQPVRGFIDRLRGK
jgi:cephalosporin hydroxylase